MIIGEHWLHKNHKNWPLSEYDISHAANGIWYEQDANKEETEVSEVDIERGIIEDAYVMQVCDYLSLPSLVSLGTLIT